MRDSKKFTGPIKTEIKFVKLIPSLTVLGVVFLLDRLSKNYILDYFKKFDTEIVVNDYLNFDLVWNSGVAFGFFSFNDTLAYHLMTLLISIIIIFFLIFFRAFFTST